MQRIGKSGCLIASIARLSDKANPNPSQDPSRDRQARALVILFTRLAYHNESSILCNAHIIPSLPYFG